MGPRANSDHKKLPVSVLQIPNSPRARTVCFWHDDGQDEADAEIVLGGPNRSPSLRQAQNNFRRIGAVEERFLKNVRQLLPSEIPN